jgi:hypothetical protein
MTHSRVQASLILFYKNFKRVWHTQGFYKSKKLDDYLESKGNKNKAVDTLKESKQKKNKHYNHISFLET